MAEGLAQVLFPQYFAVCCRRVKCYASAERHGLDPQAYLTSILANIATTPLSQLDQFLPDVWKAELGKQ